MTSESRNRFDKIAENYATSEVHSMSPTIRLLHQLVNLETGASVCDVACGGRPPGDVLCHPVPGDS